MSNIYIIYPIIYIYHISYILYLYHISYIYTSDNESCNTLICNTVTSLQVVPRKYSINPLNAELNPICCLLALLGAHHFFHVSRISVKSLTLRLLMSYIYIYIYIYIYMEHPLLMFLDHTQRRTTVGRTPLDE